MMRVLLFLSLVSVVCAEVAPVFYKLPGDQIQVIVPGVPGVKAVIVKLVTNSQIKHAAHLAKARSSLTYVIQYKLPDYVHETTGSVLYASNAHYQQKWTHESMGRDYTHAAIHYGARYDKPHRTHQAGELRLNGTQFTNGFHSYWMDWTADYIKYDSQLQGDDIWASGGKDAPFDRPFYLIMNVAVGGGWFWEWMVNSPYPQPWHSNATKAEQFQQFWQARHLWEPTWHAENTAMRVRSVTMEQY
ncbi:hypothetical protein ACOMHN_011793 [Nucella lapillus]